MFPYKRFFLQRLSVLGLAVLLIFADRVSHKFFDVLLLHMMCNNNIDLDPGVRY